MLAVVSMPWGVLPSWVALLMVALLIMALCWFVRWLVRVVRMFRRARLLPNRLIAVARLRNNPDASMDLCDLVGMRRTRHEHVLSWPRTWCGPMDANQRGGRLMNELWPGELPLPVERRGGCWLMRSRRVD